MLGGSHCYQTHPPKQQELIHPIQGSQGFQNFTKNRNGSHEFCPSMEQGKAIKITALRLLDEFNPSMFLMPCMGVAHHATASHIHIQRK